MSDDSDWIDELYAEGRDEQPPAELDERIRASARKEIDRPWYNSAGRLATLATAASLVLATMVIYYVPDEPQRAPGTEMLMDRESISEAEQTTEVGTVTRINDQATTEAKLNQPGQLPARSRTNPDEPAELLLEEVRTIEADSAEELPNQVRLPEPASAPQEALKKAERSRYSSDEQPDKSSHTPASGMGRREMAADTDAVGNMATRTLASSIQPPAASDSAVDIERQLAERCGPLPGSEGNRVLNTDAVGWYLITPAGEDAGEDTEDAGEDTEDAGEDTRDARYWRCQDGAWIEIEPPLTEASSDKQ